MSEIHNARLLAFIQAHTIQAEHLVFSQSTHSVAEAAAAVNATPEDFVKSICFVSKAGEVVVAIVKGEEGRP